MNLEEAKQRAEKAADEMSDAVHRDRGYYPDWAWLDDRRLRLYDKEGQPLATLHVENTQ